MWGTSGAPELKQKPESLTQALALHMWTFVLKTGGGVLPKGPGSLVLENVTPNNGN